MGPRARENVVGSLVKNYQKFQDSHHRALSQSLGPSKCKVLCDRAGGRPVKPALYSAGQKEGALYIVKHHMHSLLALGLLQFLGKIVFFLVMA